MRFSLAAFLVQMPHLNVEEEGANLKGSPLNADDRADMAERLTYARKWIEGYAPEKYQFGISAIPSRAEEREKLSAEQKKALAEVQKRLAALSSDQWNGKNIHEIIHAVKKDLNVQPQVLFQPLYRIFLNRDDGPQAGWFLSTIKRDDVLKSIEM